MKWLEKLLKKKPNSNYKAVLASPLMLSQQETIEFMHNKELEFKDKEVVSVTYNENNDKRYIILKNNEGNYSLRFEKLFCSYDEDTDCIWIAHWEEFYGCSSLFASEKELLTQLKHEPAYKLYFEKEST